MASQPTQKDGLVASREVVLTNRLGMHMRPARQFVEAAGKFRCRVTVYKGNEKVNGKSIMEMMLLAATHGTPLRIEAEGEDAEPCLDALVKLANDKFYED
jgi:phosphocarrier protein